HKTACGAVIQEGCQRIRADMDTIVYGESDGDLGEQVVKSGGEIWFARRSTLENEIKPGDDVLEKPSLLEGKSPAEVEALLGKTPGWRIERLGKGAHAGQGWVLRQYSPAGKPTGRMFRWHPGGGHHGPDPYW